MEKHVVVIYPHPDDESFGAAGTITSFRKDGVPVTYLCGTLGEMGRNMGNPPIANRETIPETREKELEAACQALDMDLIKLGYRDKTLEFEDEDLLANDLKERLEQIQPSLVITHYPPYAVHPDHNALGKAAIKAVRSMDESERPRLWAQAISNDAVEKLGEPTIVNDIREFFDRKIKAVSAHKTQIDGMMALFNKDKDVDDIHEIADAAKEQFGIEEFYEL